MTTFRSRLLWLATARVVVVTLLLGSAILVQFAAPGDLPITPFFLLIALTYALTACYGLLLRRTEAQPWIVDGQLAIDAVLVSALVALTGGIVSYFSTLYILPIIAASAVRSRRGSVTVGILSAVIYPLLVVAQYGGLLPPLGTGTYLLPPPRLALFSVTLSVIGFLAVAILGGYLTAGLREADAALRQASNRIADLQAFSQHVIDSLASGLATTDVDGSIVTFNRAAETITGVAVARAIGQPIADVLQWPAALREQFASEYGRRPLPRAELELTMGDGRRIDVGLSAVVLRTPRGETGFVFTFRDVTEVRRNEREALTQQRLAAVGEMAAGIAHEIRNPLASMSGSIQILRQELPLTGEQAQLMDIVIRESDRLNETIRSFLAYARPQRQPATRVDVRGLLTDTATLLQNSPERLPGHTVLVDTPAEPVCCLADAAQIRQIVWNLASNGLRAMPDGGALTLRVSAQDGSTPGPWLLLSVQDEGVGIAAAELDGILQPFRGGFERGTGLGLSIVHRIVSDYGGELRVSSEPRQGTTVTVALPLIAAELPVAS
jgi:two-component system sensor histidine kinase PilS (NtrC family)